MSTTAIVIILFGLLVIGAVLAVIGEGDDD